MTIVEIPGNDNVISKMIDILYIILSTAFVEKDDSCDKNNKLCLHPLVRNEIIPIL